VFVCSVNHNLDYVTVHTSCPYIALSMCDHLPAVSFVKFNPLYRAISLVYLTCLSVNVLPQGPSRLDALSATSASCPSSIPLARCVQWRLCSPDTSHLPSAGTRQAGVCFASWLSLPPWAGVIGEARRAQTQPFQRKLAFAGGIVAAAPVAGTLKWEPITHVQQRLLSLFVTCRHASAPVSPPMPLSPWCVCTYVHRWSW